MLLDSSGLLCLVNQSEPLQAHANAIYDTASKRLTHSYVAAELMALAQARGIPRSINLEFAASILNDPEIEFIWVDLSLPEEALALLQNRLDKTYSLCDAVSFVLMHNRGITEALTSDRHFEQAGFVRLLK